MTLKSRACKVTQVPSVPQQIAAVGLVEFVTSHIVPLIDVDLERAMQQRTHAARNKLLCRM